MAILKKHCVLEKHCRETLCAGGTLQRKIVCWRRYRGRSVKPRPMGQSMYGESSRYYVDDDCVSMKMKMSSMDYGRQDVCDETIWASDWYRVNVFARVKWQGAGQEVCLLQCKNWCYGFLPGIKTLRTLRDTDTLRQGLNPVPKEIIILFLFSFLFAAWFWNILHFPVLLAPLSQAPFSRQS